MACNFLGMLSAPTIEQPPVFVAIYSDGFETKRKEIHAPTRVAAYAIATRRPPNGCTLTSLRKKKAPRAQSKPTLEERVDVAMTKALHGIYVNTDMAARFIMEEIRSMAREALQ